MFKDKYKYIYISISIFALVLILCFIFYSKTHQKKTWWQPKNNDGITWQWQLSGKLDTSLDVDMYDIDLFDTPKALIDELHKKGKIVTCYFSAGTVEYGSKRPDEVILTNIYPSVIGNKLENWEKERWLNIRNREVWDVMKERIVLASKKGCDAIEPDNVNAFEEDDDEPIELPIKDDDGYTTGFNITYKQQLEFNKFLAKTAHKYGLSIALKNDIYQITDLVNDFDWALNEQCYEYSSKDYDECAYYDVFDEANKAVFGVEYHKSTDSFCNKANKKGRYWLKKHFNLGQWRKSCL